MLDPDDSGPLSTAPRSAGQSTGAMKIWWNSTDDDGSNGNVKPSTVFGSSGVTKEPHSLRSSSPCTLTAVPAMSDATASSLRCDDVRSHGRVPVEQTKRPV